jgi:superfamily II DNA or RNA helicase
MNESFLLLFFKKEESILLRHQETITLSVAQSLTLRLTPSGQLVCEAGAELQAIGQPQAGQIETAFEAGSGPGLLRLGAIAMSQSLPPVLAWWRHFAARYIAALCRGAGADGGESIAGLPAPVAGELAELVLTAPIMAGAEYLTPDMLRRLWRDLAEACASALAASGMTLQAFLKTLDPAWNLVGRVHFNLAENKRDAEAPFAFLATYTTQLSAQGRAQHVPLGQALRDYAGARNNPALLALLTPVQRAAENCAWLRDMVAAGAIFHPLRWGPAEAARLLASAADLERAGLVLRMPANWHANRPARPKVSATVGQKPPSKLGLDGLLDFSLAVTLNGETLTEQEVRALLAGTDGLVLLRGQWVEIDRARLQTTLARFEAAEALARTEGLSFSDALRMLADPASVQDGDAAATPDWCQVSAGPWLAETLSRLRAPAEGDADPGAMLHATLRPYQKIGVQWLHLVSGLGLGACLADDMGLGKTIQVISLLLVQRARATGEVLAPCLLVAPASLLANWAAEIERFAPTLRAQILHPSAMGAADMLAFTPADAAGLDLVITSYGTLLRAKTLGDVTWRLLILDEAQAVKNPNAKQTRAVRALKAGARIALTGTPVENSLGDLWSIFDVINPGLLGSAKQFGAYVKSLGERTENQYGKLRELVRPYILRRMKTDRTVIADLPDKTELRAYCQLTRKQAALYAQAVDELEKSLEFAGGIARRGLVLAIQMRLKQICNHPSHWLNDGAWDEAGSGKFARLREIAETVAARQEKLLVFTQFREATGPIAAFLGGIFGREGLVLHGGTKVADRRAMVQRFQADEAVPFFVLSLKAGGTGLTLTAASHVVHFDRWWNPAVENQATDRAFRIGQKKNVLVHKFVCRGTVEERIDEMIEAKQGVSDALLAGGGEIPLTELSNDALLRLVALDLSTAIAE